MNVSLVQLQNEKKNDTRLEMSKLLHSDEFLFKPNNYIGMLPKYQYYHILLFPIQGIGYESFFKV